MSRDASVKSRERRERRGIFDRPGEEAAFRLRVYIHLSWTGHAPLDSSGRPRLCEMKRATVGRLANSESEAQTALDRRGFTRRRGRSDGEARMLRNGLCVMCISPRRLGPARVHFVSSRMCNIYFLLGLDVLP